MFQFVALYRMKMTLNLNANLAMKEIWNIFNLNLSDEFKGATRRGVMTLPSFFRMRFNWRLCSSWMLRVTLESTNTDWRSGFNLYKQTPDSLNPSQSPLTATICLVLSLFFPVFFQPEAMCHTQVFKTIILALCLFIQQHI